MEEYKKHFAEYHQTEYEETGYTRRSRSFSEIDWDYTSEENKAIRRRALISKELWNRTHEAKDHVDMTVLKEAVLEYEGWKQNEETLEGLAARNNFEALARKLPFEVVVQTWGIAIAPIPLS